MERSLTIRGEVSDTRTSFAFEPGDDGQLYGYVSLTEDELRGILGDQLVDELRRSYGLDSEWEERCAAEAEADRHRPELQPLGGW